MSKISITAFGATILLATCGVASAQLPYPGGPAPSYAPPSPVATYGEALSQSDAQGLLAVLAAAKTGDSARIRAAMAGLYDPLANKIALWALADATPDALGEQETASAASFPPGWPRADRRQVAAQRQQLVSELDDEFETGWLALTRFNNPKIADDHFSRLQQMSQAPLTQSRALYWRGRAADAMGDGLAAQLFYSQAAEYPTTFYGQLAAAKTASPVISLGRDPVITAADRSSFEGLEAVRATRVLWQIGAKDTFDAFVTALSDALPNASQEALLVDLVREDGDPSLAMRVVRNAARRGFILPERGYPLITTPVGYNAPEAALVLGIVRQESSFDPMAHSGAGARGMMQLMPATAQTVANRLGVGYGDLYDATYNMTLGSAFLGQLVSQFDGSYVMAAAAYNAGPGRPPQWAATCGDPRSAEVDPVNFIECIPFDETRNYVMRVLEATQVYRARLRGGSAPITLPDDLRRGGYGHSGGDAPQAPVTARTAVAYSPYSRPMGATSSPATMAPIPDPVTPEP
jgi:soluble lytic murein transglycosylase-like protein